MNIHNNIKNEGNGDNPTPPKKEGRNDVDWFVGFNGLRNLALGFYCAEGVDQDNNYFEMISFNLLFVHLNILVFDSEGGLDD